jgi:hypothetical protein
MVDLLLAMTGMQMYGNIKEAQAQAESMQLSAAYKRLQAIETQAATQRERRLTMRRAEKIRGAQISSIGRSGVDLSSASAMAMIGESMADAMEDADAIDRAGRFKVFSLTEEAAQLERRASGVREAGWLNAFSSGARGAYKYSELTSGREG